jgi:hypothetical protein
MQGVDIGEPDGCERATHGWAVSSVMAAGANKWARVCFTFLVRRFFSFLLKVFLQARARI